MLLALSATAFAKTWGLLEWNEELQQYEITIYDDGEPDDVLTPLQEPIVIPLNPSFDDYNFKHIPEG